jgi:hypothetical protein
MRGGATPLQDNKVLVTTPEGPMPALTTLATPHTAITLEQGPREKVSMQDQSLTKAISKAEISEHKSPTNSQPHRPDGGSL